MNLFPDLTLRFCELVNSQLSASSISVIWESTRFILNRPNRLAKRVTGHQKDRSGFEDRWVSRFEYNAVGKAVQFSERAPSDESRL